MAGVLEETAARLLHAAGVAVTAVDIESAGGDLPELRPGTAAARAGLATATGTRDVVVNAGYGLKLAVAAWARVRAAGEVMDRLAVPVHGEDVHALFLLSSAVRLLHAARITVTVTGMGPAVTATQEHIAWPGGTRQVTTRLAGGLALAVITGAPLAAGDPLTGLLAEPVAGPGPLSPFRSRQQAPPRPPGHRAGLVLRSPRQGRRLTRPDPWHDPGNHFALVAGTRDRTRHEVTAQVPADAISPRQLRSMPLMADNGLREHRSALPRGSGHHRRRVRDSRRGGGRPPRGWQPGVHAAPGGGPARPPTRPRRWTAASGVPAGHGALPERRPGRARR